MDFLSTREAKFNIVKKYIGAGDQFNTTEVANLLHMSRRELTRRVRTGDIRDSSKNTHIWVSKDDLAEYIVNNEYVEYAVYKNITFTLKQLGKIYRDASWFKTLINRCDIKPLNSPLRNHVYRYIDIINAMGSEHSKLSVAERSDVIAKVTEAFRKKLKAYDDYNNPDIHMQNSFQIEAPVKEEAKPVDGFGNRGRYTELKESVNQLYGVFKEELKPKTGDPDEALGYKKDTSEYDDSDDIPAETKCKLCNSIKEDDEPIKTLLDNNEKVKSLLEQPTDILTAPKHEYIGVVSKVHMTSISAKPEEINQLDSHLEDPKKIVGGAVLKYRANFMVKLGSVSIPNLTVRDQNRFLELLIDFEEDLKIFTNNIEPDNIEETTVGQLSKEMEV